MIESGKLLCLKEVLIKPEISTKALLQVLYDCFRYTDECSLNGEGLARAYKIVAKYAEENCTADINGKKHSPHLIGDDPIREEISRLLFGIPLKNLRRREERILSEDPVGSAAFDKSIQPMQASVPPKAAQSQISSTKHKRDVSTYTVQHFNHPDERAFDGYVGNAPAVRTAELQIKGALIRGDRLRSVLLRGASGCGKTEFGIRFAKRSGRTFYYVSGSTLKTAEDVDMLYDAVEDCSIVFVDETQASGEKAIARILTRLSKGEEGQGKEVTIIFATNLSGKLPDALRNRCIELKLCDYTVDELMQISNQIAKSNGVELADGVAKYISERCHKVARYAVDYTHDIIVENAADQRTVTLEHTIDFFARRGIDSLGLCAEHRQYISRLAKLGQASAHSLAAAMGENSVAEIERSIEPLLLKHGLININSRGRCLTEEGIAYVKTFNKEA